MRVPVVKVPSELIKGTDENKKLVLQKAIANVLHREVTVPVNARAKTNGIVIEERKHPNKVMCKVLLFEAYRSRRGLSPRSRLIDFVWVPDHLCEKSEDILTLDEMLTHKSASIREYAKMLVLKSPNG